MVARPGCTFIPTPEAVMEHVRLPFDRQAWCIYLEDLLVARTRFSWARQRQRRGRRMSRSHAAVNDLAVHQGELVRCTRLLALAGGDTASDAHDRRLARSIARD